MKDMKLKTSLFNQLIDGFEKELIKENKDTLSVNVNLNNLREFLIYVEENGITSMKTLQQHVVDSYFVYLEQERTHKRSGFRLSPSSIGKHQATVNNFLKYLNAEQVPVNAIRLKRRKRRQQKPSIALSQQEIQWLYSVTDTTVFGYRDRCMLALYYGCGMRKSEGLRLLLTDIDFGKGRIHVRKTKTSRERYVMMSPVVQRQVEEYIYSARDMYLSEDSPHEQLFISERGAPMHPESMAVRIEVLWKRVQERYGGNKWIGCHVLRHSLGTHLYMAGMDIENVALMLGHRTLEATQLYIHLADQLKSTKNDNNDEQI